ncbi:hypothetical protein [Streptomyces sp. NPDC049881]|uniref:hypothetical protein n=1 Tax=Streptomyces sp. NPDC049881 TaxID=3155778 RepID=UPI003418BDE0
MTPERRFSFRTSGRLSFSGDMATRIECGMVSLLLEIFTAELGENPLSGTALWGKDLVRFLHQRDEEALRTQGIDPWTGEPDPFAGMFGEGT